MAIFLTNSVVLIFKRMFWFPSLQMDQIGMITEDATGEQYCPAGGKTVLSCWKTLNIITDCADPCCAAQLLAK